MTIIDYFLDWDDSQTDPAHLSGGLLGLVNLEVISCGKITRTMMTKDEVSLS